MVTASRPTDQHVPGQLMSHRREAGGTIRSSSPEHLSRPLLRVSFAPHIMSKDEEKLFIILTGSDS